MDCSYCRAQNDPDDHRCSRCGRRLHEGSSGRPGMFPVQHSAAAPQIREAEVPAPAPPPAVGPQLVRELPQQIPGVRESVQASLFGPMEVAKALNSQSSQRSGSQPRASERRRPAVANPQQSLNFESTTEGLRSLPASVPAARHPDAGIAPVGDRIFAAVIDTMIPVMGFVLFLTAFHFTAGGLVTGPKSTPFYAASFLLLTGFYRILCCVGNSDTLGIQCAGLRLLNFDGRPPGRRARFNRLASGLISAVSLGIGLLWALLDEEKLTWHDHMSGTFPIRRMQRV